MRHNFSSSPPRGPFLHADTPDLLLAMEEGGASIIELGIPYTDPQADGTTIQQTNQVAIKAGTSNMPQCLEMVKKARSRGLTVPVVLMGYYNPFFQFDIDKMCTQAKDLARSAPSSGGRSTTMKPSAPASLACVHILSMSNWKKGL